MDLVRVMVFAVFFIAAVTCIIRANVIFGRILDDVNSSRGANDQISFLFVNLRLRQVLAEHRELLPADDKRRQMKISLWIGFALFAVSATFLAVG
jgi:hypothetical protein